MMWWVSVVLVLEDLERSSCPAVTSTFSLCSCFSRLVILPGWSVFSSSSLGCPVVMLAVATFMCMYVPSAVMRVGIICSDAISSRLGGGSCGVIM